MRLSQNFACNIEQSKQIKWLLLSQKSSENYKLSDDFSGNREQLICLNSLNNRSEKLGDVQ